MVKPPPSPAAGGVAPKDGWAGAPPKGEGAAEGVAWAPNGKGVLPALPRVGGVARPPKVGAGLGVPPAPNAPPALKGETLAGAWPNTKGVWPGAPGPAAGVEPPNIGVLAPAPKPGVLLPAPKAGAAPAPKAGALEPKGEGAEAAAAGPPPNGLPKGEVAGCWGCCGVLPAPNAKPPDGCGVLAFAPKPKPAPDAAGVLLAAPKPNGEGAAAGVAPKPLAAGCWDGAEPKRPPAGAGVAPKVGVELAG
mmetsp:Transcript_26747/g.68124  ORF Transcript_26747/g.68124 Transcript_26747/m.68124 type:complete len:248 (+) Transcript_26747:325-1068(+)